MKKLVILLFAVSAMLFSCNGDADKSDAFGNFEADPVMVAAQAQGQLLSFEVQEGQALEAGVLVGYMDTVPLVLKKEQLYAGMKTMGTKFATLDAQIRAQEVQVQNLERELKRVGNLLKDGAATQKQFDDLEGNVALLKAQKVAVKTQKATISAEKQSLEVQVKQVDDQISRAYVENPVSGIVLQKYKEAGEIVAPGLTLYKIANLDELILRAYVSGEQLSSIVIGNEVRVRIDGEQGIEELTGVVVWVSSQAEFTPKVIQTKEERVNLVYAVKVKVKNDGRLKIGMPGELKL